MTFNACGQYRLMRRLSPPRQTDRQTKKGKEREFTWRGVAASEHHASIDGASEEGSVALNDHAHPQILVKVAMAVEESIRTISITITLNTIVSGVIFT